MGVDGSGNVYVADQGNHTVRKISAGGVVTTLAGSAGITGSGDGTGSAARLSSPGGVAVDSAGFVYVGDTGNHTIRKITADGVVTTLAGTAGNSPGETIVLTLNFDGPVNGLTSGTDSTIFTVAGTGVSATWSGADGTSTRTLTYMVATGHNGQAAIDEGALKAALAGIVDVAGNAFTYNANGGNIPADLLD